MKDAFGNITLHFDRLFGSHDCFFAVSVCFLLECWIGRGCGCVRGELSVSFALQCWECQIYGNLGSERCGIFEVCLCDVDLALPLDRRLDELWEIPPR